jgi:hypothetical protein
VGYLAIFMRDGSLLKERFGYQIGDLDAFFV